MTKVIEAEPINHRTRVGRQRRERTRQKILDAAFRVFARKGTDAPLIEDFIAEAGIARGTFYNYFHDTSELLQATVEWLSTDIVESIEDEVNVQSDPFLRLAIGIRLWLDKAEHDLVWAAFVARPEILKDLPFGPLRRDIHEGHLAGLFQFPNERVAFDLLAGTLIVAMRSYTQSNVPTGYTANIVRIALQGLGADPDRIEQALAQPLPTMWRTSASLPTN